MGLGRYLLFWSIALGGTAFDLVDQVARLLQSRPPRRSADPLVPHILELHTSHNTGALWGFGANDTGQQLDLRRPVGRRRGRDPLLPLRPGRRLAAGSSPSPWA